MSTKVRRSSDNVFRDLGFRGEEAEHLRLRAELMIQLRRVLAGRKRTQAGTARLFGVTQPRVSDLARGKIDLFSIDALVNMLARAGAQVRLTVHCGPSRPKQPEAT